MSFLDRFQNKIATVTAHGHLKKADGSEEIRVGPPKRRPKAPVDIGSARAQPAAAKPLAASNNVESSQSAAVNVKKMAGGKQDPGAGASGYDNNRGHRDTHHHSQQDPYSMPERLKDDYRYDEPQTTSRSQGISKSPSPAKDRHQLPQQQRYEPPRGEGGGGGGGGDCSPSSRSPRATAYDASPQKETRSPSEINEARVQSDADQLAFSRKARPVQYEPCKLAQYKKEKPAEYYELGKLQPDLNSDELVQKRANAERIKAFSKNLRAINKTTQPPKKSESNNDAQSSSSSAAATAAAATAAAKNASTRSKALEFAKRIPKPKHSSRASPEDDAGSSSSPTSNIQSIAPSSRPINSVLDDDSEDDEVSSELQQLQLRHQLSRAQVDALIRKS